MPEGTTTTTTTTMPVKEEKGLARKLTSSVVAVIAAGLCLVLINYAMFITESIPDWGSETKDAMVELEQANMARLASDKAEHTGYVFGLVKDALQQLQGFAEQALPLAGSETMEVDRNLMSFPGLEQETPDTNHSVWYIPGLDPGTSPAVGSSLDGLLNRTALMDVLFRGIPREELMYLAALDDPSLIDDPDSSVVLQAYPAYNLLEAGFTTFNEDCDDRFDTGDNDFSLSYLDPRCRVWFQDARADSRNGEPIFTDPYASAGTGALTITPAAPVYATDGATLLGVVGIDMDFALIEASILGLRIMGDEGYAYLLTPTGGEVAAHPRLDVLDGIRNIVDLEPGVDRGDFGLVVERMTKECAGSASYQKSGETWLVSWEHETVSRSGADAATDSGGGSSFSACSTGGFIVAVTVSEDALLGAFSKTESEILSIAISASVVVVLLMTVTVCLTVGVARSVSTTLTWPVNQLVDIVKGLNNLDFSEQDPGVWMLNDINCPEVEELMEAFKSMTTIIHFGNQTLGSGDLDTAHKNYCDALFLFTKLNNDRGVSIVRNNLGNVCTLQARALTTRAKVERKQNKGGASRADALMCQADRKYEDAVTNFRLAIEDSEMAASAARESGHSGSPHPFPAPSTTVPNDAAEQNEGATAGHPSNVATTTAAERQRLLDMTTPPLELRDAAKTRSVGEGEATAGSNVVEGGVGAEVDSVGVDVWASRGMLAGAAMLYGTNFGCVKLLEETVPMSLAAALRFSVAFVPFLPFLKKIKPEVFKAGSEIGLLNAVGYWAQSESLMTTTASKSAFICSLSVIFVPLMDAVLNARDGKEVKAAKAIEAAEKKSQGGVFANLNGPWFPALLAAAGVACLELIGVEGGPNSGDLWALGQPLCFGVGFWLTERCSRKYPEETFGIVAAQLLTVAVLAIGWCAQAGQIPVSFESLHETVLPSSGSLAVPLSLLWTGLVTTSLTVFGETFAMKQISAAESTIILSTEPIWGTAFAAVLLGETIGWNTGLGAMLIVAACTWSSVGPAIQSKLLSLIAATGAAETGAGVDVDDLSDTVGTVLKELAKENVNL